MGEFINSKFGDLLIEPVRNGVYKQKEFHGRGVRIVNMGELFAFPRIGNVEMKRVEITQKESEKILLKKDDLIFARRSLTAEGAGKCSIIHELHEDTTFESSIIRARIDKEKADPYFLYYYFNSPYGKYLLGTILRQVAVAGITGSDLMQLDITVPNLSEQTAIASVLSSLDDKIDLLHRQNATLEKMAETLFRQWFVEEAKEEWEEKKLGEILTITSSKRIFYSEYTSHGIPFYRSKEIIELRNVGATKSELYISHERFNEINSKFGSPKAGDILMTSVGTLGVAYRVKSSDNFYFKDGNLTWFKDFKEIPSSIIYLWLISKIGQEELAAITIGSTQQALTIEGLKSISFKVPPREIISKCAIEFDSIILKIDSNQTQIRTLTTLRDTLLPKLMSGEVRVI